ncbi:hypothetical protein [Bradyrhizobium guangzhouense]|uniref:hypothetical protein n=1 Tax=Bradyrhizobium guangzhouense TaxID=1325095 RepID=UPI001FE0792D|nr:hypothetical protein [Bradyrhizobium guangzhouense]
MSDSLNEGVVGDTAKLMAHRLIVRMLRRDPSLVEKAKMAHVRQADQFAGWPFVREWQELLGLPAEELASSSSAATARWFGCAILRRSISPKGSISATTTPGFG